MNRVPRRSRLVPCLAALTALAAAVMPAHAQPAQPAMPAGSSPTAAPSGDVKPAPPPPSDAAIKEAAQRYDRGLSLYAEGDYALAVIEFDRAYQLIPDYRVLHNIGQVRIQLGQYAKARRALEQYRREGGDRIPKERRAAVDADLEMVSARTATLRILTNVDRADVLVDDEVVGSSPLPQQLLLNAGEHRVAVRKVGYQTRTLRQALAGRDDISVRIDLEAIPEVRAVVVSPPVVTPDDSSRSTLRWAAWSTVGALVAGAAITGGLGVKAAGDLGTLRETRDATRTQLDTQEQKASSLLLAADILGGAAIASGGVALYLTLTRDKPKRPSPATPRAELTVGPTWVGVHGAF